MAIILSELPGFYIAKGSNLSGDPAIDWHDRPDSDSVVREGEVYYVHREPKNDENGSQKLTLEPVLRGSCTRYVKAHGLLEPATPEMVWKQLDKDMSNANPVIESEIRALLEKF